MGSFFVAYAIVELAQLLALALMALNLALHRRMINDVRNRVDYSCWVREGKPDPFIKWQQDRRRSLITIRRKDAA